MPTNSPAVHLHLPDIYHWYMGHHCMDCKPVYVPAVGVEVIDFDYEKRQCLLDFARLKLA